MKQGMFFTFEGMDGTGKSTQLQLVREWLQNRGEPVLTVREPGGTELGEQVRGLLLEQRSSPIEPVGELCLFLAARAQLCAEVIRPALEAGITVMSDRFTDSTLAYQGYGRGIDLKKLREWNHEATGGLQPTLTFLFELNAEEAARRLKERGGNPDRMEAEQEAFRRRVLRGYEQLAELEPKRIKRIAAARSREVILKEIQHYILEVQR